MEMIVHWTECKKNRFIFRFSEDMVEMYAILMHDGDKKEAYKSLNE